MAGDAGDFGDGAAGEADSSEALVPVDVLRSLAAIEAELARHGDATQWWRATSKQLSTALERVDDVRRRLDRVRFAVTAQVAERGLHNEERYTLTDYLAIRSPWISQREVTASARVADRLREAKNAVVRQAVQAGSLSVERADALLRSLRRLEPFVDIDTYGKNAELLLPLAQMGADKELRTATEHLVALATPELSAEHLAKARTESCKVYESSLSGGMRRFIIEADPEGAATLDAIFGSPLTKPVTTDGDQDDRSPGRRRYDALMTVLDRGMSHPEGVPTTAKVSLMVTVDYDILQERLGRVGHSVGTTGSAFFTAGQVRKLGCQAGIVPTVLGTDSQPLDLGRTRRLATPAQLRALYQRDRCCTFPGCSMPPVWCEAHHTDLWWSEGGTTDVRCMALLCRRHHSWVHAWDPEVTITRRGVIWHLDRLRGKGFLKGQLHTDGHGRRARPGTGQQRLPDLPEALAEADGPQGREPASKAPGWFEALGGQCADGREPGGDGSRTRGSSSPTRDSGDPTAGRGVAPDPGITAPTHRTITDPACSAPAYDARRPGEGPHPLRNPGSPTPHATTGSPQRHLSGGGGRRRGGAGGGRPRGDGGPGQPRARPPP